jgi:signal transduction histidine kinase
MKFSWKILFNTFLWVLIALSIGSTIFISISFEKSITEAREGIIDRNRMQKIEIATLMSNYNRLVYQNEDMAIKAVIKTLNTNWGQESGQYRIRYWNGEVLDEKNLKNIEWKIELSEPAEEHFYHAVYTIGGKYYIQGISSLILNEETIIIESMEDISPIFDMRENQSTLFLKITVVIGMMAAICNFFLSKWMTRSIIELENITKLVANGELEARVEKISDDEIGSLARKFNEMAETLEHNMEELKEAARRQEDFVGSFSHELKTPLTSIIGYADLLRTQNVDEDTKFGAANYIFHEGKRLENLSLKMLELIVERKKDLKLRKTSINQLVTEALTIMKSKISEKEIRIQVEMEKINAYVDSDLMKTVFINLLDNAIKAVEINGVVKIILKRENDEIILNVCDNGCGIAKEDVNRLTEAFYMVDKSRSRRTGGVGLGLSICRQIMELHNGRIEFESEVEKGTKVSLKWKEQIVCEEI